MNKKPWLCLFAFALIPTLTRSQNSPEDGIAGERAVRYVGRFVGHTSGDRAGEDIGRQINEAYASLPTSGGTIIVVGDESGRCFDFATPIIAAVPGKYLLLEGGGLRPPMVQAASTACLNYTPTTSSSAITLDYAVPGQSVKALTYGIRDLVLANNDCETVGGCASSATGITLGGANAGSQGAIFENLSVIGFGTGLNVSGSSLSGGNVWFHNCTFSFSTTGFGTAQGDTGHISFDACNFQGNGTAVSSNTSVSISNSTLDSNSILAVNCSSPGACDLTDDHFENANADTTHYLAGNGVFSVLGGDMRDDKTTGTTDWWMHFAGASFFLLGTVLTSGGRTASSVILNDNPGLAIVQNNSPTALQQIYSNASLSSGTSSSGISTDPVVFSTGVSTYFPQNGQTTSVTGPTTFSGGLNATSGQNKITAYNVNKVLHINDNGPYTTVALALAACPSPPAGCHIIVDDGTTLVTPATTLGVSHCQNYFAQTLELGVNAKLYMTGTMQLLCNGYLEGENAIGSGIFACTGTNTPVVGCSAFPSNTPLVDMGNNTANIDARVENLWIDCLAVTGCTGVRGRGLNEYSTIHNVFIQNYNAACITLDGSAVTSNIFTTNFMIDTINCAAATTASSTTDGVQLINVSDVDVKRLTVVNASATKAAAGVHIEGYINGGYFLVHVEDTHCEMHNDCILVDGNTGAILHNVDSSNFTVNNLRIASTANNHVVADFMQGGSTAVINNQFTGTIIGPNNPPSPGSIVPLYVWTVGSPSAEFWQDVNGYHTARSVFPESITPSGLAGSDLCYGDSTAHALKCSYNNGSFLPIPQLAGDLGNTAASPQVQSTHLSNPLPTAQGGTGQSSTATFPKSGVVEAAVASGTISITTNNSVGCVDQTTTASGATTSMKVLVSPLLPQVNTSWAGYVSGPDTVAIRVCTVVTPSTAVSPSGLPVTYNWSVIP